MTESSDAPTAHGARPARNGEAPTLLELVRKVHAGTLTPEEAVQIFITSRVASKSEPSA
ncbi:MAG TPA: hypothetical protein VEO20_02780 [Thermoplasmata archaeon]|nr:hypothetical protein [Thermoplasmata archaeon]